MSARGDRHRARHTVGRPLAGLLALALVLVAGPAYAAPRKVLVLPLDGTAAPATRTKLSASLQRMARVLEGEVEAGEATFVDTATAIGCVPSQPACVENVRATLGVDELVYGVADGDGAGNITLVVTRYAKAQPVREQTMLLAATDPASKVEVELLPVFSAEPMPVPDTPPADGPDGPTGDVAPAPPVEPAPPGDGSAAPSRRARNVAIVITAGGGLAFAIGLALWAQAGNLQDDIDAHRTDDVEDFRELAALEDKASARAWAGNVFVIAGLAVAAYGGWRLYTDHKAHQVTVTPTPVPGGGAVTLTWRGW